MKSIQEISSQSSISYIYNIMNNHSNNIRYFKQYIQKLHENILISFTQIPFEQIEQNAYINQ